MIMHDPVAMLINIRSDGHQNPPFPEIPDDEVSTMAAYGATPPHRWVEAKDRCPRSWLRSPVTAGIATPRGGRTVRSINDGADTIRYQAPGRLVGPHSRVQFRKIAARCPDPKMARLFVTKAYCCAITLPVGRDRAGMPFGLQLTAPANAEEKLLTIALMAERVLGTAADRLGTPPLLAS